LLEKENMRATKSFYTLFFSILTSFGLILLALFFFQPATLEGETEHSPNPSNHSDKFVQMQTIIAPEIPSDVSFCGEKINLQDPDILERLDRELIVNTYLHSSTLLLIKRANRYFPQLRSLLQSENIPEDMLYLCVAESALYPSISPSGAAGFWQFMQNTAREYGLYVDEEFDERYDIEKATKAACQYLKESYQKLGSWSLAAAAYNAGNNGVAKQKIMQRQDSYFDLHLNSETSRYVFRIIALKYILKNPTLYGFHLQKEQLYAPLSSRKIQLNDKDIDWISFAEQHQCSYKTLKYLNPQIRSPKFANKQGRWIDILLPSN
jgi:membrane-bound lytic murein transglycosylase D